MKTDTIHNFVTQQLSTWSLAASNFEALGHVHVREIPVNGLMIRLQFNPARMISSAAKLTKEDIARRRCFLCEENRPDVQENIPFKAPGGHEYHILVNPYPIFPDHLVIAKTTHKEQAIAGRYSDMLALAHELEGYTIFYNGPHCGASAPDHHHFQAAPRRLMPLEIDVENQRRTAGNLSAGDVTAGTEEFSGEVQEDRKKGYLRPLLTGTDSAIYHYGNFSTGIFVIASKSKDQAVFMFEKLLSSADIPEGDAEPRINLYTWWTGEEYVSTVYFRRCHRSHHYFSDGPDHLTMSPGCADMAGVFIVPVGEEYQRVTSAQLSEMISEVTIPEEEENRIIERLTRTQPALAVGIMAAEEIEFQIEGESRRKAVLKGDMIELDGVLHKYLHFKAAPSSSRFAPSAFTLHDVTIGVKFHWERKESQTFAGDLMIVVDGNRLQAINVVGLEDYLLSVISSEMSSTASEEFLKAHAVISRSWVMARMKTSSETNRPDEPFDLPRLITWLYATREVAVYTGDEYMKWYDHDDHRLFDVCADDHCQRYQGLTRATGETVRKVIDSTWGQVLMYGGQLCDARFSKCCGGRMEKFSTCWQDKDYPYLQPLPDSPQHASDGEIFCNTKDKEILGQVLNNYDQETTDFYEWTETLEPEVAGALIERKFGVMTGPVQALEPLERGESGRISKLRIVGKYQTITVGKELEIRRILSDTHLKSSAFEVEYVTQDGLVVPQSGKWEYIRLRGRGWGHGVGLCQIGAAVMASRGYTYHQILQHYYPGSCILQPKA